MLFLLSFEALLCARVNIVLSEVEAEVPTGEVVASSAMASVQQGITPQNCMSQNLPFRSEIGFQRNET
jgi:hypothetical protein